MPPAAGIALYAFIVVSSWHHMLGGHWLDPALLRRGLACAALAQLGFLCCSAIGGLLAGLQLSDVDFGTGRVRARWLIGRRIVAVRTVPLPIRFGFNQPRTGVPAPRRWVVALVPALASATALAATWWQLRHPEAAGPVPAEWLRPATYTAVLTFGWLAVLGGQLNVPSQLPNRWVLWHPRRGEHATMPVDGPDRKRFQRIFVASCQADVATMRAERTALAGSISEFDSVILQCAEWYHQGRYATAATAVAPLLDSPDTDNLSSRYAFCTYAGLATIAGQPVDPDVVVRARELCPVIATELRRDLAAFVLTVFAIHDRDHDLARRFGQQVIRWTPNRYDAGEAELLMAIAAAIAGETQEARVALRRGRRRAPGSPLVAVAERRLAEPPAISMTVDAVGADD
ncbi:hypothetical protein NUM_05080 [Actinocatenispora comari]|uniref:Tetratricopeptide repeat protein n=2 Tax=Actinocatenispora comari TaxID=2807577 RepID=A0A8J4EIU7_9ACTN|nr:hypothetical protein NUM_05080 [Actinocatenispora comari]